MKQWEILVIGLLLALIADGFLMLLLKKRQKKQTLKEQVVFLFSKVKGLNKESAVQLLSQFKKRLLFFITTNPFQKISLKNVTNKRFFLFAELAILAAFSLYVGRPYLELNPNIFVAGSEFAFSTASHYVWNLLPQCGTCVFWNGYLNGGSPSFVELHGAFLHPLVILTTLVWGVVNGSKIILLLSFFMVGFGQWWLAKELNVGPIGRLWSGLLVITGGHLFGR